MDTDNYFSGNFRLPTIPSQTGLFGVFNNSSIAENLSLKNHIVFIFKLHTYKFYSNIH